MFEEAITAGDQLTVIRDWLENMEIIDQAEEWSYGDIAKVQNVYELVKADEVIT